ncbi:MAG: hypothetical protein ACXAEU_14960 [Candidatus Hodarchaeales archaeon]
MILTARSDSIKGFSKFITSVITLVESVISFFTTTTWTSLFFLLAPDISIVAIEKLYQKILENNDKRIKDI